MTDYIKLYVKKRSFKVLVDSPEHGYAISVEFPTPILWDNGTEILWDDGTEVQWNIIMASPRIMKVKKRSFKVLVNKR